MSLFRSYRKFATRQKKSGEGKPLTDHEGKPIMETVEVPRWSTEATIAFLRANGRELTRNACRDGWHINLIDFVQHQHRMPNQAECEELVLDFQKIEQTTQHSQKRPQILAKRVEIKNELLKPIELKAAG